MRSILIAAALVLAANSSFAGSVVVPPPAAALANSGTETKAFVGLNWVFGSGEPGVEGVLGVMRTKVKASGSARAMQASLHMNLTGGISFSKVKISALSGRRDAMAQIGVGFGQQGAFGSAGAWAPHVSAGIDGGFNGSWQGYVGLHSLGRQSLPLAPAMGFGR